MEKSSFQEEEVTQVTKVVSAGWVLNPMSPLRWLRGHVHVGSKLSPGRAGTSS